MKTNSAAKKRFKKTGTGKIKAMCAFRRHLLTHKTTKRKRKLRAGFLINPSDMRHLQTALPYQKLVFA